MSDISDKDTYTDVFVPHRCPIPSAGPYTDEKGAEYQLHTDFQEGDIVLLGKTTAYRIHRSALAECSVVFADIFADGAFGGSEIHLTPDEDDILTSFLTFLRAPQMPQNRSWQRTVEVIDLIRPFECTSFIQDLLLVASKRDPGDYRKEAFALACEFDHLPTACRLLEHAGSGEGRDDDDDESLRPTSKYWTSEDAAKLSHHWLWALTCAVQWAENIVVDGKKADKRGEDYWTAVIGAFMLRMSR